MGSEEWFSNDWWKDWPKDTPKYIHNKEELIKLYNTKIVSYQKITRSDDSLSPDIHPDIMVVTTEDGRKYLLSKVYYSGKYCWDDRLDNTFVLDVSRGGMSSDWKSTSGRLSVSIGTTVGDLVEAERRKHRLIDPKLWGDEPSIP